MRRWTRLCGALAPMLSILIAVAPAAAGEPGAGVSANDGALISIDQDPSSATALVGPPLPERAQPAARAPSPESETEVAAASDDPRDEAAADDTDADETPPAAGEADSGAAVGPDRALPARESRGLGTPNGLFSARPVDEETSDSGDADEPGAAASLLTRLDPRSNPVMRVLASLGAVLGLLFLFKLVMKRGAGLLGQGGRPSGVIEILARYPLGRKQSLVLLKLARRVILLHQNGTQMTTLSEMSEPREVAALLSRVESGSTGKQAQRFRSMLKRFEADHERATPRSERDDLFPALTGNGAAGEVIDLTRRSRRPRRRNGRGVQA